MKLLSYFGCIVVICYWLILCLQGEGGIFAVAAILGAVALYQHWDIENLKEDMEAEIESLNQEIEDLYKYKINNRKE